MDARMDARMRAYARKRVCKQAHAPPACPHLLRERRSGPCWTGLLLLPLLPLLAQSCWRPPPRMRLLLLLLLLQVLHYCGQPCVLHQACTKPRAFNGFE